MERRHILEMTEQLAKAELLGWAAGMAIALDMRGMSEAWIARLDVTLVELDAAPGD